MYDISPQCADEIKNRGRKILASVDSMPSQQGPGYYLANIGYGVNNAFTTHEDNSININIGKSVAQCSGKGCTGSATITQTVQQRMSPSETRGKALESGASNIINLELQNDVWVKNGQGTVQCLGTGCKAVSSLGSTVNASERLAMPDITNSGKKPIVTILFENVTLGQANIINIGDLNSDSICVGDGSSQCIGKGCYSSSEKSWKNAAYQARTAQLVPSILNGLKSIDGSEPQNYTVTLKNMNLGLGNVINIGNDNTLSINIGDGASQCVGDKCKSIAEKRSSYSSRNLKVTTNPNEYNGIIEGTSKYPFTLVFKKVRLGEDNVINIGHYNRNGAVVGDGVTQCVGYWCHSAVSKDFSVVGNSSDDIMMRSLAPAPGDPRWSLKKSTFVQNTPFPFELENIDMGEANVMNFGRKNTISINTGDGTSQCVGDKCVSESIRAGDFSSLPNRGESNI